MNIIASSILLLLLPLATWWFAIKGKSAVPSAILLQQKSDIEGDKATWKPTLISLSGILLIVGLIIRMAIDSVNIGMNEINLILFSMVLIAFPQVDKLSRAMKRLLAALRASSSNFLFTPELWA